MISFVSIKDNAITARTIEGGEPGNEAHCLLEEANSIFFSNCLLAEDCSSRCRELTELGIAEGCSCPYQCVVIEGG